MIKSIKHFIKKPLVRILITVLLLAGAITTGQNYLNEKNKNLNEVNAESNTKPVQTIVLDLENDNQSMIKTVGTVKAEARLDILATTRGTVKQINFEVGDIVPLNQVLVSLYDNTTLTSLNNAQINYINMQNSLDATKRTTDESIRQAEIGVKQAEVGVTNALESIEAAKIGLQTAQDSYSNIKKLKDKTNNDQKAGAVISVNNFLNTIYNTLEQVNYIIKAEGDIQLSGISSVLGALDLNTVNIARNKYETAKACYLDLSNVKVTTENITSIMGETIDCLAKNKDLVDSTITVLNNTVTSSQFPDATLIGQKNNFVGVRTGMVTAQTTAENTWQGLQNIDLVTNNELDALDNSVKSAETQLSLAQIGYDNALVVLENAKQALENAKQGKEQQLIATKSSVDGALGQLNLAQAQTADLYIKAPIKGKITNKYIELGAEINPGQKIAEISQTDRVKIEVNLPSEEIYRVEIGKTATILDDLIGIITAIDPTADPITKKVKLEILYANTDNKLIPGTFVEVSIPTKELEKTHAESIFVPLRTVTITQNENFVFVNNLGRAKKVPVVIGKTEGAMIEIIDGLHSGDELIVDGAKNLEDGDALEIND